jgi:hypothetical protein
MRAAEEHTLVAYGVRQGTAVPLEDLKDQMLGRVAAAAAAVDIQKNVRDRMPLTVVTTTICPRTTPSTPRTSWGLNPCRQKT